MSEGTPFVAHKMQGTTWKRMMELAYPYQREAVAELFKGQPMVIHSQQIAEGMRKLAESDVVLSLTSRVDDQPDE